jgi:hypothetical protein
MQNSQGMPYYGDDDKTYDGVQEQSTKGSSMMKNTLSSLPNNRVPSPVAVIIYLVVNVSFD